MSTSEVRILSLAPCNNTEVTMIGIYKITNIINNKVYIGQSIDIKKRWERHKIVAFNDAYPQYNCLIYKAFRKYGLNNFTFEVLEECAEEDLNRLENLYIDQYNSCNRQKGYNMICADAVQGFEKLSDSEVEQICQLLKQTSVSQVNIAKEFNISQAHISSINLGRYRVIEGYTYPIRPKKKEHFCTDCGTEICKGSTRCVSCARKQNIIPLKDMPITREELKSLIRTTSFLEIGRMFNKTDNAIRKWCDKFNLPRRKKDIENYSDEEWENI